MMKVNDLIKKLKEIADKKGNIEVVFEDDWNATVSSVESIRTGRYKNDKEDKVLLSYGE